MLKRYEPKFPYHMEELEDGDWIKISDIIKQLKEIPQGNFYQADRYDTSDEYVLHLWKDGKSYGIRIPKEKK
jgi:hypothetical protein